MTLAPKKINLITPDLLKPKTDDQLKTFLQNAKRMKNDEVVQMIQSEISSRRSFKAEKNKFDPERGAAFLIEIAKLRKITSYGELNRFATNDGDWEWRSLQNNMQAIQEVCIINDYPSLTSLVANRFGEFELNAAIGWLHGGQELGLHLGFDPQDAIELMAEAREESWAWAANLK